MPTDDELPLILLAKQGNRRAQQTVIEQLEPFVAHVATKYSMSIEAADLAQEGRIGILVALSRFDPSRKVSFATFAEHYVKQFVMDYIRAHGRLIRIPVHGMKIDAAARSVESQWLQKRLTFTLSDVANEIGASHDQLRTIRAAIDMLIKSIDGVDEGDLPFDNDNNLTSIEDEIERQQLSALLSRALQQLERRDRRLIQRLYGLDGYKQTDLPAIAAQWQLSSAWVVHLRNRALTDLAVLINTELGENNG